MSSDHHNAINPAGEIVKSLIAAVWLMFLTFPLMVVKVDTINKIILWRWYNLLYVGVGAFFASFVWRWALRRRDAGRKREELGGDGDRAHDSRTSTGRMVMGLDSAAWKKIGWAALLVFALAFPYISSDPYRVTVMTSAFIWVMLGLGLNIVVGVSGLLVLGYAAFYAVGAYGYALLNLHYGIGFWTALPIAAAMGMIFGLVLGLPVLRLRGDYLAIVTLGFGEIVKQILENSDFTFGAQGISKIPKPWLFGAELTPHGYMNFMYYLMIALTILTIFFINRLQSSRLGRAWLALREDEIACQAMGVDKTKAKLTAFALGATWASVAGVVFASKTTFINPGSFTFMDSAIILSIVVLGGMGSIPGVMLGALIISISPEVFRAFADYRMLIFGAALVLMMVFRPGGMIQNVRRRYVLPKIDIEEKSRPSV